MNETSKKTLSLDFDGVCHQYTSPWQGPDVVSDDARVYPNYKSDDTPASVRFDQDCARRLYNQLRDVKL